MPAGFRSVAGFNREATTFTKVWPSSSPVVITKALPLLSEDVNTQLDQQSVVTRDGRSVPGFSKVLRQSATGNVLANLTYEDLEFLFTAAMGHEAPRLSGVLMPEEITTSVSYRHLIEFDRDLNQRAWGVGDGFIVGAQPTGDGLIVGQQKVRHGTFAVSKNQSVWETKSAFVNSLTVQVSPSGVSVSFSLLGYSVAYGGGVNDSITTLSCSTNRVMFRDCTLFVRQADGTPFSDSDIVPEIEGFQLQIQNNLQAINTRDTKTRIDEPQRSGAVTVTGGFALPRWLDYDLLSENQANTPIRMKLECKGDTIPGGAGEQFEMNLWFPSVNLTGASLPVSGPEQIQQNYSYMALAGGTPTGFPSNSFGGPLFVEFINTNGDHTLLD